MFSKKNLGWRWAEPSHIPGEQGVLDKFLDSLLPFGQNPQFILIYSGAKLKERLFLLLLVKLEE